MFGKIRLLGVLFYAISSPGPAFAMADTISPGESIGQMHLGELLDKVKQIIGREPDGGDAASGQAISAWFGKGKQNNELEVWTSYYVDYPDGRPNSQNRALVEQIRVTSPYFRTHDGLRVGLDWKRIRKAFPRAKQVRYFFNSANKRVDLYDDVASGIAFEVLHQNKGMEKRTCGAILVHPKTASVLSTGLWFYPRENGKFFDETYLKPMSHAASATNTHNTKPKPYWLKPRSFWTPANAQLQLKEDANEAVCVRIYGGSRLWHKLTGLPTNAEVIKHSRLDPEAKGILICNKKLIRFIPSLLRSSDKVLNEKSAAQADGEGLQVDMCSGLNQSGFDNAMFLWWQGKAYCYRPRIGNLEMNPGDGTQFNGFIQQMARYARKHRHGVSFYHYSVYELSPS